MTGITGLETSVIVNNAQDKASVADSKSHNTQHFLIST